VRVAVIGSGGQLGRDACQVLMAAGEEVVPIDVDRLDIAAGGAVVLTCLKEVAPEAVVNTAAMHHVERCEDEPEKAFAVNAAGARHLALAARDLGFLLTHISTDYVFDGAKGEPYVESDCPAPLNVYANSKLSGEYFVRAIAPRHFVLRVSGLYGVHPCVGKGGLNFVELMLKLARERGQVRVVDDEVLTPTWTEEIARQLLHLLRQGAPSGIYHATAEGACSWYEFAAAIFELTKTAVRLEKARPGEFAAKVARPKYSVLENAALKKLGLNRMANWRDALTAYLKVRAGAVQ